ncbi:osteopetrosis-associated transmembrane protein 1 [Amblyomma americanum]
MQLPLQARTACLCVFAVTLVVIRASNAPVRTLLPSEHVFGPSVDIGDVPDDRPWENCTNLLQTIAEVTSRFERCALMKAQPFTMCVNCATLYGNAIGIFYQLETNTTDPGTRLCQDQFFSSSKVSIVDKTFKHIHDLWKSASCDGCFQHPVKGNGTHVVRNETIMFNEKLVQMNKCINQSEAKSKNLTDLCIICERPYRDLNTFYNGLVQESKDGNICFDMVDAMNATRFLWSSHFCSVHHYQNAPAFVVAGVVGLLVILFYAGAGTIITPLNTELVQPKRLLRRRSRYGSTSPGSCSPKLVPP